MNTVNYSNDECENKIPQNVSICEKAKQFDCNNFGVNFIENWIRFSERAFQMRRISIAFHEKGYYFCFHVSLNECRLFSISVCVKISEVKNNTFFVLVFIFLTHSEKIIG